MATESTARIDLRVPADVKAFITRSAKQSGFKTVSAFVLEAALEKAERMAGRQRGIVLSASDYDKAVEILSRDVSENESFLKFVKETATNDRFNIIDDTQNPQKGRVR